MTEKEMKAEITQAHIDGYNRGYAKAKDKIADIKANCDLAIEGRDVKIMELEKVNNKLLDVISNYEVKVADLEKENAELKELLNCNNCSELSEEECEVCAEYSHFKCKRKDQITKATELINLFIQWNYGCCDIPDYKDLVKQAEQFLKEGE